MVAGIGAGCCIGARGRSRASGGSLAGSIRALSACRSWRSAAIRLSLKAGRAAAGAASVSVSRTRCRVRISVTAAASPSRLRAGRVARGAAAGAGLALGRGGLAFDLDQAFAHRLDRVGDDGGGALLALGDRALAAGEAVFGLLDPARDQIERAGGLGAGFARHPLGSRGLGEGGVDMIA